MKAVLKYNLPDDNEDFKDAINGTKYRIVIDDIDNYLREKLKYGHNFTSADEALEKVREELYQLRSDNNVLEK